MEFQRQKDAMMMMMIIIILYMMMMYMCLLKMVKNVICIIHCRSGGKGLQLITKSAMNTLRHIPKLIRRCATGGC